MSETRPPTQGDAESISENPLSGVGRFGEPAPVYPYPEILDRIPLDDHAVIEASAGTGKTYTIEHLVVDRLLRTTVKIEQLLVVTFTDKATSELRKRIRDLIERILKTCEYAYLRAERLRNEEDLVDSGNVATQEPLDLSSASKPQETRLKAPKIEAPQPRTDFSGITTLAGERVWVIDIEAQRTLERALFSFDRAAIYTIHAFCRKVLVDLAFDSGQLFEQELIDGRRAFRDAWRRALRERLSTRPELRRELEFWLEHKRELGDLEELLYQAHQHNYLELQRPFHHQITVATQRLVEGWDAAEIRRAFQESAIISSALSTAEEVIEQIALLFQEHIGLDTKARQLITLDLKALITPRRSSSKKKAKFPDALPPKVRHFIQRLSQLRLLFEMEDAIERKAVDQLLPEVSQSLVEEKRRAGQVDYDDLLRCVWRALCSPQGTNLAHTLRDRFRYALIDEFQDTDPLQWKIFRRVFVDNDSPQHALYIIGDPKQAIYTFRGADVHTYLHARYELNKVGAPRVPLKVNYRSSPGLVDAVNAILDQGGDAPIFQGPIQYTEPVECGRHELSILDVQGREVSPVSLWRYKPPPPRQKRPTLPIYQLKAAFKSYLAQHIRALIHDDEAALYIQEGPDRTRVTPSDILILVRENKEALEMAQALREVEVPFALYKPEGLLQGTEAREIYTLMKAIINPHDRGARLKAFTTPFFGVPWAEIYHYSTLPPGHHRLERLLRWHQLAAQGRYGTLFHQLLHHSGLSERELFFAESERALTNYQHIFEILLGITSQNKCTPSELCLLLGRYLKGLESPPGSEDNIQRLYSDRQMVQIMTIHKSKGLEAPIVYLYGGFGRPFEKQVNLIHDPDEGRKILIGAVARKAVAERLIQEQRQEDQRLLYVALTRAQVKLFIPFIDSSRSVIGSYQPLKERLRAMYKGGIERWGDALSVEEVSGEVTLSYGTTGRTLTQWAPPEKLMAIPTLDEEMQRIRAHHQPLTITSYTKMKQQSGVARLEEARAFNDQGGGAKGADLKSGRWAGAGGSLFEQIEVDREEATSYHIEEAEAQVTEETLQLPGGRHVGRCLHEIIEELPFSSFKRNPSLQDWSALSDVIRIFESVMRRHGVDQLWISQCQTLIYHTLNQPITLFGQSVDPSNQPSPSPITLPPLHRLKHIIEMEFLYPIPENFHPKLGDLTSTPKRARPLDVRVQSQSELPHPWIVERGFVKGFIDYIFEHRGKVYFVDWKSDHCLIYRGPTLVRHVEDHYILQAQLYTLGVVRWLRIRTEEDYHRRFGGLIYLFLRGLTHDAEPGDGVYFQRPAWSEVLQYERDLSALIPPYQGLTSHPISG